MKIRTLLLTSARRSALHAGCILIPPPSLRSIPSPHDLPAPACQTADRPQNEGARQAGGEVGRGSGRGDFKRARQFDGTSPSPQPSPRSCLARREREQVTSAMVGVLDAPWPTGQNVFSVVTARATERGLQSAGVLVRACQQITFTSNKGQARNMYGPNGRPATVWSGLRRGPSFPSFASVGFFLADWHRARSAAGCRRPA